MDITHSSGPDDNVNNGTVGPNEPLRDSVNGTVKDVPRDMIKNEEEEEDAVAIIRQEARSTAFGEPLAVPLYVRDAAGVEVSVDDLGEAMRLERESVGGRPLPQSVIEEDEVVEDEAPSSPVGTSPLLETGVAQSTLSRAVSKLRQRSIGALLPNKSKGVDPKKSDFDLQTYLHARYEKAGSAGLQTPNVFITYKDLSVFGNPMVQPYIETVGHKIFQIFNILPHIERFVRYATHNPKPAAPARQILMPMQGFIKPGEMTFVLGRPGAGCSTLLRTLSNNADGLSAVNGQLSYNGIDRDYFKKHYSSYVAYNPEDEFLSDCLDPHYAALTVRQTLRFVLETRIGGVFEGTRRQRIDQQIEVLLRVMGLQNCADTKVGDENIRGCSGGEKKRVSIAEQICAQASVGFWDGSTKGLDSSSALDFVRALRTGTDITQTANVLSLYQASQDIYDLFDRVILMANGRCIYFGPASQAKAYFESLGFYCPKRKVTPDFLTGITEIAERDVQKGWTGPVPTTAEDFERAFLASKIWQEMNREREALDTAMAAEKRGEMFGQQVTKNKEVVGRYDLIKSQYTTSLAQQFKACIKREEALMKGNVALIGRLVFDTIMAIVVGSAFFRLENNPAGTFSKGGAIFFGILYNCLGAMASVPVVIQGRAVASKHKSYKLYRTYITPLVMQVADMPVSFGMVIVWSCINYWMVGLRPDAGAFFTYILFLFATNQAFGGLVRIIASIAPDLEAANQINSVFLLFFILYTGYIIPYSSMKPWFIWVFWINPLAYGVKSLLENEFDGTNIDCRAQFWPPYPGVPDANKACVGLKGGTPGSPYVNGMSYLDAAYGIAKYSRWWNLLILMGIWIVILGGMMAAARYIDYSPQRYSINAWKKAKSLACRYGNRRRGQQERTAQPEMSQVGGRVHADEETGGAAVKGGGAAPGDVDDGELANVEDIALDKAENFTWKHIDYTVPVKGGPKQLLNDVSGYVRSGQLTAMMGSSGAGKTTLIDAVSQRKTMGNLTGQIYVGHNPQGSDFRNITAYCEQMDVHNGWQTVREALQFSARLRQPAHVPARDKDIYVEKIIQVLELDPIANAVIGEVGGTVGISQEQRKRVTIGVELVARPKIVFLDEPTSGLDSQAAFNIVRLLRNLADNGQAILCTIHQPSAVLFEQFDALLLLARGGRTVYFGELGHDCEQLLKYFERQGAPPCPPTANVAEYMLDVIGAGVGGNQKSDGPPKDWTVLWKSSPENQQRLAEIDEIRSVQDTQAKNIQDKKAAGETMTTLLPFRTQLYYVMSRMIVTYWRNPSYNFGRVLVQIFAGLLIGFSFFQLDNTATGMQNKVFAIFMAMTIGALLINLVQPNYIKNRSWFTRESAAGFYDWKAFALAVTTAEWAFAALAATVFFLIFYFTVGLNMDSSRAGYFYITIVIFQFFAISLGQMIAAVSPTVQFAAILNPFFLSMQMLFCGVTISYSAMPKFWSSWLYHINPFHYFVEGIIGNEVGGINVQCTGPDVTRIIPPTGSTCSAYLSPFFSAGGPGQLISGSTTDVCEYCVLKLGDDFMAQLGWSYSHRWRNFGILIAFWAFNLMMVMFLVRMYRTGR
ncbi:ABC-2 type transporter-domain-containing protein [Phlyctochytrium arcticum]|nr:ABC-2 type transporter-domain-containing protein [Phlyctochytrium arcticum]